MKKILLFLVAVLISASAFASIDVVPSDDDLASYATGTYTMCIYNESACADIVLIGTYVGWNTGAELLTFQEVEGFEGWYVVSWDDESGAAEEPEAGVQAKPVQLDGSGNFNWDYQLGPDAELIRGTASIEPGNINEVDIKNIAAGIVVIDVKSWKKNPCTAVYHIYNFTLVSPDCNDENYVVPAISGGFNNWAQEAMTLNELKTAERQQQNLPGAVFEYSVKAAEGSEYKFRSAAEWGADWTNQLKAYDAENDEWAAFNGGANLVLGEETELVFDFGDPDLYSWDNCEMPEPCDETPRLVVIGVKLPVDAPAAGVEIIGTFDEWAGTAMNVSEEAGWYFAVLHDVTECDEFKFREAGTWDNEIVHWIATEWMALDNIKFKDVAGWGVDETYKGDPCYQLEIDLSDPSMYRWSNQSITPPIPSDGISVTDNSLADWDALPAEYVFTSICPDDAALIGLKSVKVYADATYINILVEPDMNEITELEWVPFHVFINTDNSDATGGYGDSFTDANTDIMLEGALFADGVPYTYNPAVFKWWGRVGGSGWEWTDMNTEHNPDDCWGALVCEGQLFDCSSQYVNGKFEIKINRNYIPANWNLTEFGIGFDIMQDWTSVGILPLVSPTEEDPNGHAHKIQVLINNYAPEVSVDTTTVRFEIYNNTSWENLYAIAWYPGYGALGNGNWTDVMTNSYYEITTTLPVGTTAYLEFYDLVDSWNDLEFIVADTTYQIVVTNSYSYFGIIQSPLIYTITDPTLHTVSVVGNTISEPMNLVIPNSIDINGETYTVTSIGSNAFMNCDYLLSVELGENITSFGSSAFSGCNNIKTVIWNIRALESNSYSVDFGGNVEMLRFGNHVEVIPSDMCTNMTKLTELEIPASVRSIGDNALFCGGGIGEDANHLRKLVIHSVNIATIDAGYGMVSGIMLNPNLDTLVTPANLIGDEAFYIYGEYPMTARKISYLKITAGELTDEWSAMKYIRLSERTLKTLDAADASNTTLPDKAFSGLYNLTSLILPANLESISYKAVEGCVSLTSVSIPASVQAIEPSAFENCRSLTTIDFGAGSQLQSIGNWAFYNAHALTNLTLPEGVEHIGEGAFYGCTYLENVHMPASVHRIADNAFALCEHMTGMTVEALVPPTADARTFYGVSRNIPVYVPNQVVTLYQNAPVWQEFFICPISEVPSGIENSFEAVTPVKILRDGQVLILRGDKTYNVMGGEVK